MPASVLVYYPFYGITYDRKDYYRIEVIDGVTGKRQDYLERIVTVRPQNKIENSQPKIETVPPKDIQPKKPEEPKMAKFEKAKSDEISKVERPKRGWKMPKFRKQKN